MASGPTSDEARAYARLMAEFEALAALAPAPRAERLDAWAARDPAGAEMLRALLEAGGLEQSALDRGPTPENLDGLFDGADADSRDGRSAPAGHEPPAALGETIGAYELVGELGRGGMGFVYEGRHVDMGRTVAVKVLYGPLAQDTSYVRRFFAEAKTVNDVRHPRIVDIFDFVETEDPRRVALVMARLDGPTLAEVLERRCLSVEEAVHVSLQLADALTAVHAQGVVHRDLKPENVMCEGPLEPEGEPPRIKLLDFGIAKVPDPEQRTATGAWMGTPAYMAPEQFSSEPVTAKTDIYALAELIVEMLTQRLVFEGEGLDVLRRKMSGEAPELVLPHGLGAFPRLGQVLQACLRPEPQDRPSLDALADALYLACPAVGEAYRRPPAAAPRVSRPRATRGGRRRWRQGFVLGAALVAVGAWSLWPEPAAPVPQDGLPFAMGRDTPALPPLTDPPLPTPLPAVVYGDGNDNRFTPTAPMGAYPDLEMDLAWRDRPHSGETCLRVRFLNEKGWAGAGWTFPELDWGSEGGGIAPLGATELRFWARGEKGGERVKIGYGLIPTSAEYFDTAKDERWFTLTAEWQAYRFDLRDKDLRQVEMPFFFVVEATQPTFYLDDIRFE